MFEGFEDGFGIGSSQDIEELNKALSAGYEANTSMTGGAALRVESLESSLKVLTFREEHCVMWKDINKLPAYSTVEEYSQQTSIGDDNTGFTGEGVLPEEDNSGYARKASLVKFLGTTRRITHPMQLVRTVSGDAVARETTNGILKVMRDAEFGLYWGNSKLVYDPTNNEGTEWDGLNTLIDSTSVVDLGNRNIEEGDFSDVAQLIADSFGYINKCYMSNSVTKTLDKGMLPKERIALPTAGGMEVGATVDRVKTSFGTVAIKPAYFLGQGRSPKKKVPAQATHTKAPVAPASGAVQALAVDGLGKFRSTQYGAFKFQVTACNRYGESAPTALSSAGTITSADVAKRIPVLITNATGLTAATVPQYYNIYATEVGGSVTYLVGQIAAASQADGGTTTYNYDGYIMANTSVAFAGQFDNDVMTFKQLAPIMKMDLAVIDPSYRFMILMYGVFQLFAPKKVAKIINIKDY